MSKIYIPLKERNRGKKKKTEESVFTGKFLGFVGKWRVICGT